MLKWFVGVPSRSSGDAEEGEGGGGVVTAMSYKPMNVLCHGKDDSSLCSCGKSSYDSNGREALRVSRCGTCRQDTFIGGSTHSLPQKQLMSPLY